MQQDGLTEKFWNAQKLFLLIFFIEDLVLYYLFVLFIFIIVIFLLVGF